MDIQSSDNRKLLRILGVGFGLSVAIGGMIGVGILRTPGIIAANLGFVWLIIAAWVFGGIYTLIAANSYAELGTLVPKSGGPYVFARKSYGDFGGFLVGWSDWFLISCTTAYIAVAAGEYLAAIFPALTGYISAVAVLILSFFFVLHLFGLRVGSEAQKLTSLLKVVCFLILIVACFVFGGDSGPQDIPQTSRISLVSPFTAFVAIILSMQAIIETYAGYNSVVYFSEENTSPERDIPRALFGSVLTVVVIYLLVNLALFYVLPVSEIADSKLAAASAAEIVFGKTGGTIITILSLISLLSIINAMVLQTPRTLFAMSNDGLFFAKAGVVSSGGAPVFALVLTIVLAIVLAASGTFDSLLGIAAFMGVTVDCLVFLALFVLRKREPDSLRPFKAWGYPYLPFFILVVSVLLLVAYVFSNTESSLIAIVAMSVSYPVYLWIKRASQTNVVL